ncbi:MAG: hypothetical protein E5X68_18135 [Mesorhizobium sp.]|nr:MAG: hypothetical protein EOQ84_07075 [Mesorhizobium sp.]RWL25596.1 MAG: hypothetical protein EOR58_19295 [Mesorhizobium sp.]RWL36443.1 MAG: hypothetical protein EOR63_00350 [Mesorhizobium sp.]RWL40797.1 MAG: hypothetical protein EOR59_04935 [Mesorhizobium sp.]RWL44065.1 MAG: hypothetical protein EOR61_30265 [Mesorhizobium sp.]
MPIGAARVCSLTRDRRTAPYPPAGTFSPCSDGEKEEVSAQALQLNVGVWRNPRRQRPSPRDYMGRSARQGLEGQRRTSED